MVSRPAALLELRERRPSFKLWHRHRTPMSVTRKRLYAIRRKPLRGGLPSPWLAAVAVVLVCLPGQYSAAQSVGLVTLDVNEVANGYPAETLKMKTIVNDKNETIGKINDFIFSKDGRIFAVLSVGDFIGAGPRLVAVPFNSLKLDDSRGFIVLPGANRAALDKLPVYLNNAQPQASSSTR